MTGQAAPRQKPPGVGHARPFSFPPFEVTTLASGLRLLVAPDRRLPLVQLELGSAGGGVNDPVERPGLAAFTAAMLDEGTRRRSGPELAALVEGLGAELLSGVSWECAFVELAASSRHLATGVELLGEVVLQPSFPADEVERERRRRLAELLQRASRPDALADDVVGRVVYDASTYGHTLLGSAASLGALTAAELASFHRRWTAPAGSFLLAAGDVEPAALVDRVRTTLGDWPARSAPAVALVLPPAERPTRIVLVDRPQATQSELRVAQPGLPRSDPDFLPLQVLSTLLGGKFTSRLNLVLRERLGITYGVRSSLAERRGAGPFLVAAAVANDAVGRAAQEIVAALERLRDEPPAPLELAETKSYLVGVFPYTVQTLGGILWRLRQIAVHDLPRDHFDRYAEELEAIDAATVHHVARRPLRPWALSIVAVGPAAELEPQLGSLGPVERLAP